MGNINREYIEEYIRELTKEEGFLEDLRIYAEENNIPIIHPEVRQFLKVLISIKKPKKILEIGTAIGYSSMLMADIIDEDSKVYTIERNEDMIQLAKKNIKDKYLEKKIIIVEGDAEEILLNWKEEVDMIFIDGAKGHYKDIYENIFKNLKKEGIIVSDNVLFQGMVASDDLVKRRKKTIVQRMRSYLDHIMKDDRVESSIIPIGDGVAISYKRG